MIIYAIDDDPVSRLALSDLVRRLNLGSCLEFDSAEAAWNEFTTRPPPGLVLCDVRMPGMSGVELLQSIRQVTAFARIPVVMVTSATDREVVQDAARFGAAGYIVKPFVVEEARARLSGIVHSQWSHLAEDPVATLRRLSIPAPKLSVYFSAYRRQIDEALQTLGDQPTVESEAIVLQRLDALQTGSLTLGLWHGARILDAWKAWPRPAGALKEFIIALGEALDQQRERVKDGSWRA